MLNGEFFFPLRRGIFCIQKMGRNDRSRDNRGTAFAYHERLPSAKLGCVETGGTHQSGPGTEGVRLVNVGIIVAVTEGVFVSNGKSISLVLMPENPNSGQRFGASGELEGDREPICPSLGCSSLSHL